MGRIKRDVADAMRQAGAVDFQIGRFYRWREGRDALALALALHDALKQRMDPHGLLNPGVLA